MLKTCLIVLALCGSDIGIANFAPENDFYKYDDVGFLGNVSQTSFESICDRVEAVYRPIFEKHGMTLTIFRDWQDSTVNAYASIQGRNASVNMFGGLARRPEITDAGFALVVCHEIGHHLAGYPFVPGVPLSAEGQADYFGTAACARKIIDWFDALTPEVKRDAGYICDGAFPNGSDNCLNISMAAQSTANLLAKLAGDKEPSIVWKDESKVRVTNTKHPRAQCRLDTFMSGNMCSKSWNDDVIPRANADLCRRPRCWFAG